MMSSDWEWPVSVNEDQHGDRIALMREIYYESTCLIDIDEDEEEFKSAAPTEPNGAAKALSLNISSGGMLLLTEKKLEIEQVVRVHVPTPLKQVRTPTLAEVRWSRELPIGAMGGGLYFTGVKFIF